MYRWTWPRRVSARRPDPGPQQRAWRSNRDRRASPSSAGTAVALLGSPWAVDRMPAKRGIALVLAWSYSESNGQITRRV